LGQDKRGRTRQRRLGLRKESLTNVEPHVTVQAGGVGVYSREIFRSSSSWELTIMDLSRDIHSLADFKKNTSDFLKQLKDTGEPVVLTVNGKAELVVQDAASYQKLLDLAEEARVVEGIRQGLDDMKAGRTISLDDFKKHVRKKHGISV
jgi:prevent-host-death family protein